MGGHRGSSPFGHGGYHPEDPNGGEGRHGRATKVWRRATIATSVTSVLGQRAIQLALRKLRRWVRKGGPSELDLDDTIQARPARAGSM